MKWPATSFFGYLPIVGGLASVHQGVSTFCGLLCSTLAKASPPSDYPITLGQGAGFFFLLPQEQPDYSSFNVSSNFHTSVLLVPMSLFLILVQVIFVSSPRSISFTVQWLVMVCLVQFLSSLLPSAPRIPLSNATFQLTH